MPKLKSRQVKFETEVPALISEMKDGEFRFTRDGLVGRLGDVAHAQVLTDTFLYMDPFDQAQLDDIWAVSYSKGTGAVVTDNGRLKITADGIGGGSRVHAKQESIDGFAVPQAGSMYFDLWGKITGPSNPSGAGSSDHSVNIYTDSNTYNVRLDYSGEDTYRVTTQKDGTAHDGPYVAVETPGANEAWWRIKYMPGDAGIKVYWQHQSSPLDVGWRENTKGANTPPGADFTFFEFRVQNNEASEERIAYFDMRDWVEDGALVIPAQQTDAQMIMGGPSWEILRAKTVADTFNDAQIKSSTGIGYSADGPGGHSVSRPYIWFPLNFPEGTVISKAFFVWDTFGSGGVTEVIVQEIDAEFPLSASDWDSPTGPILIDPYLTHNTATDDSNNNVALFNEDGLAYLNSVMGGAANLCVREYNHDYLDVNPLGVTSRTGCTWQDNNPPSSGMQLHLYFESPSPSPPLQVRGERQAKMDGNVPVVAEDMEIGELRITSEGLFGRTGGVVQKKDWLNVLFYDDFEDDVIDPRWTIGYNKTGGTATEENGELIVAVNPNGSAYVAFIQNSIQAIPQEIPVPGEYYFDIWGKMEWDTPGGSANCTIQTRMLFSGGGNADLVQIQLIWDNEDTSFRMVCVAQDGVNSDNTYVSNIDDGLGGEVAWWRLRYLPGDSQIRIFWQHKDNPHRHGWEEYSPPTASPNPSPHNICQFTIQTTNNDTGIVRTARFNEVANWVGEEITTTTTTTTTTTISCGASGGYYEFFSRDDYNTDIWTLQGTEGVNWEIEADTILNLNIENNTHFDYSPGGGRGGPNKQPFVLPIVNVDILIQEISTGSGTDWNNLISIEDYIEGPGDKLVRSYIDHTTGELVIRSEGPSQYWTWDGAEWQLNTTVTTGVVWELNKWWEFTVNRNSLGQWRIVIENEKNVPVITTGWRDWTTAEFEDNPKWGSAAASVVLGYRTSGPGGIPKGKYRRFSCCSGMRRFIYSNFDLGGTPIEVDNWIETSSVGAGGTLNIPDSNYRLTFDMNGMVTVPSEVSGVMPFGNTAIMDLDEFDVWGQLHLQSFMESEDPMYIQWLLTAHNVGVDHEAGVRLYWTGSGYQLLYRAKDGFVTDDWTVVRAIPSVGEVWVRMRYLPSQGDTKIKLYFTVEDPETTYGWTPIDFPGVSPNMDTLIQANGAEFEMKGYNSDVSSRTMWITDLHDARRDTFETTTTTTTT